MGKKTSDKQNEVLQKIAILGIKLVNYLPKKAIKVKGYVINPCKHVFYPGKTSISNFFVKHIDVNKGDIVLDMGCGTGILAISCAKIASKVVAVDITSEAVDCAQKNIKLNNLEYKIDVRKSDLFQRLKKDEKFDLIIFNPPLLPGIPKTKDELMWFDQGGIIFRDFLRDVNFYLKKNGRIQVPYTSTAPLTRQQIESYFKKYGLNIKKKIEKRGIIGELILYTLSF